MERKFLKVAGAVIELPDAQIGFIEMEPVRSGWVVRLKDASNFEGPSGMIDAIKIALRTTNTIAGYKDGEVELWDVIAVFEDEDTATFAGRKQEQMAIYQIETGRLKWIS